MQPLGHHLRRQSLRSRRRGQEAAPGEKPKASFDVPCPVLAGIALAVRAVLADDQAGLDQRRQVPPQRRARSCHGCAATAGRWTETPPGRCLATAQFLRIKAQQRIQHRQCAIRHAEQRLCLAQRPKQFPFVDRACRHRSPRPSSGLPACQASSAAAQRASSHFQSPLSFTFHKAKEIRSPKTVPKTLDYDSRKCDSLVATYREGLPRRQRLGAFFFCGLVSCVDLFELAGKAHRAFS